MMGRYDTAPAIVRQGSEADRANVEYRYTSNVRFERGLGDVGTAVEVVTVDESISGSEHFGGCPRCGSKRMVRSVDYYPDEAPTYSYWCLNFGCQHFVGDELEIESDAVRANEPTIWTNTTECPNCGARGTRTVSEEESHHLDWSGERGHSLVRETCDECIIDDAVTEVDA